MATPHSATFINHNLFIYIAISLLMPMADEGAAKVYEDIRNFPKDEKRLTREYHLRQGALRGLIVKPGKQYDLQPVEMFLGIPYAAAPVGHLRFMPPVSAPPWSGVKMATHFAPVCPQTLPVIKKGNPPSLGRQRYLQRLKTFLTQESEDCLYLNIYVPYREHKTKKFPVLVFIHGDSFEWSSGNPYDGKILSSYGNIMVITVNFRLGVLGFMKPSITEHVYGNNGLLDQLAALQWIKDNIEDLNGDPNSVTLMGQGTGAACVNFLMLSPISNGLFHRAILMSGTALSESAMTKDPTQYTLQVAQSLGCNLHSKNMMTCLQNKPLQEIKKVQIFAREFETPLGPVVAGSFIPNEPIKTMEAFPNLLSKYQLLCGVTELESYHDFGVIELDHGILENQRDEFIKKFAKIVFEGAEDVTLKEVLKQYSPSKLDPQRWSVETNRDVILNLFSDARTLAPMIKFANYQSKANRQSYFYVFGHNSISTDYAPLNKSVHGEELPYVLGIPLGGANTHFHSEYTLQEKLLSEVVMRLWTNFVKNGSPNTQSVNEYFTLDKRQWNQYNVEWPEYNVVHQPYLRIDLPPSINSLYRSNYTNFWIETLPNKMKRYVIDPLFEFTHTITTTHRPKPTHRIIDTVRKIGTPPVVHHSPPHHSPPYHSSSAYGMLRPYSQPVSKPDTETIYREIQSIKTPARSIPRSFIDKTVHTTAKPVSEISVKTSSTTVTLVVSLSILFLAINIGICGVFYYKKRKSRSRERTFDISNPPRAEAGEVDVIGQKSPKDDKSALKTLKNGCSVIKSMSINKMRSNSKKDKKKEVCKTPKSDDSGGFRERFQLRRHLSTSTLDAHTKVRDWIANGVMHRCSPSILRKSNSELNDKSYMNTKPYTRSEELLSDSRKTAKPTIKLDETLCPSNILAKNYSGKNKTSEKTTSTSALDSHSSLISNKQSTIDKRTNKSSDSLKSKGTDSVKSKKVSVAIDATPAARTHSILKQEPIEFPKSFDEPKHSKLENKLQRSKTDGSIKTENIISVASESDTGKTYTNEVTLALNQNSGLKVSHKHSTSDPVTDVNYETLMKEKLRREAEIIDILPPVTFRNEINVTSRDDKTQGKPLSAEDALLTIKRRNFPKVLPDLPNAHKRLSLQPSALQTFRSFAGGASIENQLDRSRVPPQPPPRTTTLERRLAYKNTKPLSSFDVSNVKKIPESEVYNRNYENIDSLSPVIDNRSHNKSFDSITKSDKSGHQREYPKVIIASSNMPCSPEPTIIIKPSPSQIEIPSSGPRVRLPDDFHSRNSGSVTSFSSFYSDDDINEEVDDDFLDNLAEDKLIQELVGGVESPTDMDVLDSKGPETIFEKKVEIVPVKINAVNIEPRSKENYVCISDLHLPDMAGLEQTAQIKPKFGLNKLKNRSESINSPPERAVKLKPKKSLKPSSILNRATKSSSGSSGSFKGRTDSSKLEHSNSGSSNDTETSTGTVKMVELK